MGGQIDTARVNGDQAVLHVLGIGDREEGRGGRLLHR
jgi:hypothetical protein